MDRVIQVVDISILRQLRVRKALLIFKDVPLRTRRALSLYNVYGDNALPVLSGVSLNRDSGLLDLNWRFVSLLFLFCLNFFSTCGLEINDFRLDSNSSDSTWYGGGVVYWCGRSTLALAFLARVWFPPWPDPFDLQQNNLAIIYSPARGINGGPLGCEW